MYQSIKSCRVCGGEELETVMALGNLTLTGVFPRNLSQPVTNGPLTLVRCTRDGGCGLVQLRETYDLSEMYGINYGYRSGLNNSMVQHLRDKVKDVLDLEILNEGDIIIDIGSNDATTLKHYPQGRYQLIGVDPTGIKFKEYYPPEISLIPDFFSAKSVSEQLNSRKAKVVTSFSVFYDLEAPMIFAQDVADILAYDGIWVLEQSYLPSMLKTNSFDTICHEHLEFYALKQIKWIAEHVGLKILDVCFNDINGGSFSVIVAKNSSPYEPQTEKINKILKEEDEMGLCGSDIYSRFEERVGQARIELHKFFDSAKQQNKKVLGLAASTKGNVLLQYFNIESSHLPKIGEINEDKYGCYTPGSEIPLVPEADVLNENPEYIMVLPWHYKEHFLGNTKFQGRKLVFPLPNLEIVEVT